MIRDERPHDPAIAQAVDLLRRFGLAPAATPSFRLVTPAEFAEHPEVAMLRAFRLERRAVMDPVIYVVRTNAVYRLAQRGDDCGYTLLASTTLHELVHGTGEDERAAIRAEVGFLRRVVAVGGRATDSLMWQVRELEHRLQAPQLTVLDRLPTRALGAK